MPVFPTLSSGAVCQYPIVLGSCVSIQILRFLDGSDQRFRSQGEIRRRWQIKLNRLTTAEAIAIEQFFVSQSGTFSSFDFPDPATGAVVSKCRFGDSLLDRELAGLSSENFSLWVIETNA